MATSGTVAKAVTGTEQVTTVNKPANLMGWALAEATAVAVAVTVTIRNGDGTGDIVAVIELQADRSHSEWFGPQGIRCDKGIHLTLSAGTLAGAVFYA